MRTPLLISIVILVVASGCAKQAAAPEATETSPSRTAAPAATVSSTPSIVTTVTPTATPTATAAAPAGTVPYQSSAPDGAAVTISAVGDISLARQVVDRMVTNGAAYPFALVAPLMTGEIGFGNLEGALTDRGEIWPKGYNFRTPTGFASALPAGHISVVSLANNHTMDYAAIGLQDTMAALDVAGVKHAGAGGEISAWAPAIIEANGLRVAFVACVLTPNEVGGFDIHAWAAGPGDAPGVAVCDPAALRAAIARARQSADFVVAAVHAGTEYDRVPDATQRELAQAAIAAGADAYIGAHAHVVQPIEQTRGSTIAWGLGNFVFDLDAVDLASIPEPRVSLILNLTLTKGQGVTAYDCVAVTQDANEDRPRPATAAEGTILRTLIAP